MPRPVCAIVGAGEGLGRSLAVKFASNGHDIALVSRTEKGSSSAFDAASKTGANVRFFPADVTKPESIEQACADIARKLDEIDLLIYNVRSEFVACEPLDLSYSDLEANFQVEVVGAFAAAKAVLPSMIKRGSGSVFFSSATAAFRGSATYPHYAIGKFGLRALSQSLAKAYSKNGVHIAHFRLDCDLDVPAMRQLYGDRYKPGLLANPDDVAESYLLTYLQPKSAWSNEVEIRPHTEKWTY